MFSIPRQANTMDNELFSRYNFEGILKIAQREIIVAEMKHELLKLSDEDSD